MDFFLPFLRQRKGDYFMNYKNFNSAILRVIDGDYSVRINESELDPEYRPIGSAVNILIERFAEMGNTKDSENDNTNTLGINKNPVPVILFDEKFNIKDANPAFFDMTGYEKDYLYGMNAGNFNLNMIEGDTFKKTYETKETLHGKFSAEVPKGMKVIERHLIPYLDEKGEISAFFGIYADVTESERNKERIKELESVSRYYQNGLCQISENLNRLADGNIDLNFNIQEPDIYTREIHDLLLVANENLINMTDSFDRMADDVNNLTSAGMEGRLDARADVLSHKGKYALIVDGVNKTLDAVLEPVNELIPVLDNLSVNDYSVKMTGSYEGDFAGIFTSVNSLTDRLNYIQDTISEISEGNLQRLDEYRNTGKRSENDNMVPAFIKMMEAIKSVVDEAEFISGEVKRGSLKTRVNPEGHNGDYYKIVDGFATALIWLQAPLNEAKRMAGHFSDGDYSVRFTDEIHLEGDFLEFKEALNEVAENTSDMIRGIKNLSEGVMNGTNEISRNSIEVIEAVEKVAVASQKGTDYINELLEEIEKISEKNRDLSDSNLKVAETSAGILCKVHDVADLGENARVLGNEAGEKMGAVEKITQGSVDEIEILDRSMSEINNVVKVITDITNQINLLALNAAIEAARAGEHGRGFAVVAGEVKNLATEARSATNHIDEVISSIKKKSEMTADSIKSANLEVGHGVDSVNRALFSLNDMINQTNEMKAAINEINDAIVKQVNITEDVVDASENGMLLIKNTQAEIVELSALAQETSASTEEIGSAIHEVNEMTEVLNDSMEMLNV